MDRIQNEDIRGTEHVRDVSDEAREARVRWFGHAEKDGEYIERGGWKWHTCRRTGRRAQRRFVGAVREDMNLDDAREEDAEN